MKLSELIPSLLEDKKLTEYVVRTDDLTHFGKVYRQNLSQITVSPYPFTGRLKLFSTGGIIGQLDVWMRGEEGLLVLAIAPYRFRQVEVEVTSWGHYWRMGSGRLSIWDETL